MPLHYKISFTFAPQIETNPILIAYTAIQIETNPILIADTAILIANNPIQIENNPLP